MAVELKSISPTSYLVRRYCPSQYSRNTYTPSTYARKYSGINTYPSREASGALSIYPRRESSVPPVGFEVIRRVRESPRSSMSRDRSSLSSDRAMASREFQTPIDKLMKQARIRMSISQHRFMYSWFKYRKLYIYVRIYVWIRKSGTTSSHSGSSNRNTSWITTADKIHSYHSLFKHGFGPQEIIFIFISG